MAYTSALISFQHGVSSLELVSLYVKNYKSLQDVHINLNPKFMTHYDNDGILHIKDVENYFPKECFSNVKLLCGENGVGKTSVLELLQRPNLSDGNILVMKTASNEFISSSEVKIIYNNSSYDCNEFSRELKFNELSIEKSILYEDELSFHKNFIDFYIKEKNLFDDIDVDLITGFIITDWRSDEIISLMLDSIRRNLDISHVSQSDLDDLREKDILSYLFYKDFGDSSFEYWVESNIKDIGNILEHLDSFNICDILINIRKIFYNPSCDDVIHKVVNKLNPLIESEFTIDRYSAIKNEFIKVSKDFDSVMSEIYKKNGVHYWKGKMISLFYFRTFKVIENKKRYLNSLSSGELISIRNRYHLYAKMLQNDSSIILEDEPDSHLHPEWSRIFIKNFFDSVGIIRKYLVKNRGAEFSNKVYNFVLTTHSPLILSDFFNEEVIFFQKRGGQVFINESTESCFAGNIGDMLINNFFLSKTIGGYSEGRINEIIKIMDEANKNKSISDESKKHINFIISRIGDKLLKKLLEDKFMRVTK